MLEAIRRAASIASPLLVSLALLGESAEARLRTELLLDGLEAPTLVAAPRGDPRLFILERAGRILLWRAGQPGPVPFLDIRDRVSSAGEGGLLGITFPDDYPAGGFFIYYLNLDGSSVVSRFAVSADPDRADLREDVLLVVPQPLANHNGGSLAWRDGALLLALGDGGGGGDPRECAQNPETPLGKLLRIDVERLPEDPVRVPFDPDMQSCPGPLPLRLSDPPEISVLASGLRNPFRFGLDRLTGDVWIGDVGQGAREEVDFLPREAAAPANFGWDVMEGTLCFEPDPALPACGSPAYTPPRHEYDHALGCAITGGFVYRGAIPELFGQYLFADFCSARVWTLDPESDVVLERTAELAPREPGAPPLRQIVGFGEGGLGELYIVSLAGQVFRVRPDAPDADGDDVPDLEDLCPRAFDPAQRDADGDGIGDVCECGDFDGDGRVNTRDARLIQRCSVGAIPCLGLCDATGDETCDSADARLIQRLAVGLVTKSALRCAERP